MATWWKPAMKLARFAGLPASAPVIAIPIAPAAWREVLFIEAASPALELGTEATAAETTAGVSDAIPRPQRKRAGRRAMKDDPALVVRSSRNPTVDTRRPPVI